jgi:radical SAM protein with 4Fe4S-binding SPASM domain
VLPNNKNLAEAFLFFEENKIHFIFSIATNSFDNHFSPNIEDLKTFEEQLDIVIDNYRKLIEGNNKIYAAKIINDLKRIHYGAVNKNGCVASKEGYFIDIDGNIFSCSYHSSSKDLSIGNIYTGIDYEKIIKNSYYAKPVDNYPACKVCWMKYLCSGSYFAIKWLENKNTDDPSEYLCKTYNIYWRAIIKLYIQLYPVIISGNNINFCDRKN